MAVRIADLPIEFEFAAMTVPLKFAVLAFQGFPMMAFSAVIEPLCAANTISAKKLYEWIIVRLDESPDVASNGIPITPHFSARLVGRTML